MKSKFAAFSLLAAVVLAAVCFSLAKQIADRKRQIASLRESVQERDQRNEADQKKLKKLERQSAELNSQVQTLTGELQGLRPAPATTPAASSSGPHPAATNSGKSKGFFGDFLSQMMDDPEMKKMMRQQQAAMMDLMYGGLFKELGLTPEETDKFKELLLEQEMQGIDKAGVFLRAGIDQPDKAAAVTELSQERDESEDQLKAFLGEARYAQYKDYTATMAERMELDQFSRQLASSENPLTDEQTKQLLEIMKAEKKSIPEAFAGISMTSDGDWQSMFSEEQLEKSFKQQEESNQRIVQRASAVLSPEQLQSLSSFQSSQLQMQRFGVTVAVKMFGTQKADDAPPANANR